MENGFPADPAIDPLPISPSAAADAAEVKGLFSLGEIQLTIIIFLFGLIALGLFYFLAKTDRATPFIMRIYVVIILVFGTLIVVSSSYSTSQIAPVVGFFGTIAGYLLGRSEKNSSNE